MSIKDQAENPSSTLCRFLDDTLPRRGLVADDWARQAEKAPWSAMAVDADRLLLGHSAEMRIGLDLAEAPGYWDLLSFLPGEDLRALLHGAGYTEARYEHVADTGTRDPLLLEWVRSSHPIALGSAQHEALAACWDAVLARDLVHTLGNYSVEIRRSYLVHLRDALAGSDRAAIARESALGGLSHLWAGYLRHGRKQLTGLGERVLLAPQLAGGFGIADLVAGRTLVEIKTVLEPAGHFGEWLNQLLGYVLLDWFNALCLDTVALYLSWQAILTPASIAGILAIASTGSTPSVDSLRAEFREAIQADLDHSLRAQLHAQYPIPPTATPRTDPGPTRPA